MHVFVSTCPSTTSLVSNHVSSFYFFSPKLKELQQWILFDQNFEQGGCQTESQYCKGGHGTCCLGLDCKENPNEDLLDHEHNKRCIRKGVEVATGCKTSQEKCGHGVGTCCPGLECHDSYLGTTCSLARGSSGTVDDGFLIGDFCQSTRGLFDWQEGLNICDTDENEHSDQDGLGRNSTFVM